MVSYSQISIFDPALSKPFNHWTHQHYLQGFAWRSGSVSFRTLDEFGTTQVEIEVTDKVSLKAGTIRAIRVPFSVGENQIVEVSSIDRGQTIAIAHGKYALIFETGYDQEQKMWCKFNLIPSDSNQADILIRDEALSPSASLLMEAHAA